VWGTGDWPGPCSNGAKSIATLSVRRADACLMLSRLAHPWRGTGPQVERRTAAIGCEHHKPSGRARRSGRHVAAHRAVASPTAGAQVPPKSRGTAIRVRFHHPLTGQHQRRNSPCASRGGFFFQRTVTPSSSPATGCHRCRAKAIYDAAETAIHLFGNWFAPKRGGRRC
jgi:hypothetical protein